MRPLTDDRSKPLLPVAGRPLLEHVFDSAVDVVGEFVVVGYQGEDVIDTLGSEYRDTSISCAEQAQPKGTAHAIAQAREVVNDRLVVLNGDVLVDAPLLCALADADGYAIATTTVSDLSSYGVVSVDADADPEAIVEKPRDPPTNLANVGRYAFEPDVFNYTDRTEQSERGEFEVTEMLELLLANERNVSVVEYDDRWLNVGSPWELLYANELLLKDIDRDIRDVVVEGVQLDGDVIAESGATVQDSVHIEGPAVILSDADVGPNAYIRGATTVGPEVHVGHSVEVKNSILMSGAVVPHLSFIGDSVLGQDVTLGVGTNMANLRHNDASVQMLIKGEGVNTGQRKLDVVLGDELTTGINVNLNAGVKVESNVGIEPGAVVLRDIEG